MEEMSALFDKCCVRTFKTALQNTTNCKTRNSSGDEIANVNFFTTTSYTYTTKYNRLVHKFRHKSTRLCVETNVYQIQWNNAI